jgi:hypothetical protein
VEAGVAPRNVQDLRDAEVEDLHARRAVGAMAEEQIGGFEVAVDDARCVRLGEPLARLENEVDRSCDRLRSGGDERSEVFPLEMFEDEIGPAVLLADVEDPYDVLGSNPRRSPPLAHEAFDDPRVRRERREEKLDRHLLAERDVRRGEHDRHPADPERLLDRVLLPEDLASMRQITRHGFEALGTTHHRLELSCELRTIPLVRAISPRDAPGARGC